MTYTFAKVLGFPFQFDSTNFAVVDEFADDGRFLVWQFLVKSVLNLTSVNSDIPCTAVDDIDVS